MEEIFFSFRFSVIFVLYVTQISLHFVVGKLVSIKVNRLHCLLIFIGIYRRISNVCVIFFLFFPPAYDLVLIKISHNSIITFEDLVDDDNDYYKGDLVLLYFIC